MASGRARAVALDAWPLTLALVLCLPLVRPGHLLARDLVFVPRQPVTDATVGLGDSAPRAVPLDLLVSAATLVVDGGVLARVVLPLILALAGWGAHRLVGELGLLGRLAAGGFAVWNPYVVERLALGQWALLAGYAALPWIFVAARRFRLHADVSSWSRLTWWLAVASITPTGGVIGCLAVLAAGADRSRRTLLLLGTALVLQLPWLVPGLVGSASGTSDPDAVAAFAASSEGPGGLLVAVAGLGGIWDALSVPATRDSWWAAVAAIVVVSVLVVGWRALGRALAGDRGRIAVAAGVGLLVTLAASLPGTRLVVEALVAHVPGGGLLRDSQKFLAPYVVLVAAAVGATAHVLVRTAARHGQEAAAAVALVMLPLPVTLLPDGASTVWNTLEPVTYPAVLDEVVLALETQAEPDEDLAVLPWRAYRGFTWGNGLTSSDPAVRWFDRDVLSADDLQVGPQLIEGESPRAGRIGDLLATAPPGVAMREAGVGWVLVYLDDPDAADLDLTGLDLVVGDDLIALYRVPGAIAPPGPGTLTRAWVLGANAAAAALVLGAAGVLLGGWARRRPDHLRTARTRSRKVSAKPV